MRNHRWMSFSVAAVVACGAAGCPGNETTGSGGSDCMPSASSSESATSSSQSTTTSTSTATSSSSGTMSGYTVVPQNGLVAGKTYAEWSAEWFKWIMKIPAGQNPFFDMTGASCAIDQQGPVFFLVGLPGIQDASVTRTCSIPAGKHLFFPVINYINDFPCPDPSFAPYPGQTLEEFLRAGAVAILGAPSKILVDVDGVAFADGELFRFTSKMFDFTGDPSLTANFDPCVTGSVQQGASDGWWIMLEPLPPGAHTVHFAGTNTANGAAFTIDTTYTLTVQ